MQNIPLHALSHSLDLLKDTYNYNHWVYSLLRRHIGRRLCEVGAGTGNLTQFFLNLEHVLCIEPEEEYCEVLRHMAAIHANLTVCPGHLQACASKPGVAGAFDTVVCVNVLEHIEDDIQALREMTGFLQDGGRVLLYVPAAPWAYGRLDAELGHFRRYSKRRIRRLARECGLILRQCQYVNFIGAFGWWWHSRVLRREVISPESARFVDRLVPYLSALERLVPLWTGQSLFAVLQKPNGVFSCDGGAAVV